MRCDDEKDPQELNLATDSNRARDTLSRVYGARVQTQQSMSENV